MKKILKTILLIMVISILCSCTTPEFNEVLIYKGEFYERYEESFYPTGNLLGNVEGCYRGYYSKGKNYDSKDYKENAIAKTYDNDINNIFIMVQDKEINKWTLYHKKCDVFPNSTDLNMVANVKIGFTKNKKIIDLSPTAMKDFIKFVSQIKKKSASINTQEINSGYADVGVSIYFIDYPATDNSILLVDAKYSKINKWGLYFASTEQNNSLFGAYNRVAIIPDSLCMEMGLENDY